MLAAVAATYRVGNLHLAVLSDGYMRLDGGAIFGVIPRVMWEPVVGKENIDAEHRVQLGLNCVLLRSEDQTVLIETGLGGNQPEVVRTRIFPGEYGRLLDEMAGIGVTPGDVTAVVNTHLHTDHCGWNTTVVDGELAPTFPNARYFVQRGEYEAALRPNERTQAAYRPENFEPVARSGQLELVDGEREIVPGVHLLPAPGHTADHAAVVISSGGETAIYTGDLVNHEAQIERLAWIAAFDVLPLLSLETKRRLFERAVRERALVISPHGSYPGAGRLVERDGRRRFVPE